MRKATAPSLEYRLVWRIQRFDDRFWFATPWTAVDTASLATSILINKLLFVATHAELRDRIWRFNVLGQTLVQDLAPFQLTNNTLSATVAIYSCVEPKKRLAPFSMTAMTALTTGLALVPLMIAGNISREEIEYPMAFVIRGGLVTSTLLNLFVLPVIFSTIPEVHNPPDAL